jgi:molybdopterin synthase catalytic subunit
VTDPNPSASSGAPGDGSRDWITVSDQPLPVSEANEWAVDPACGAVVLFTGTTRDHDRSGRAVSHLDYEAWSEQVIPRLDAVAGELRRRWPGVAKLALLHRTGMVAAAEPSVVVCVSAPHRDEAFVAARWGIDAVKAAVPIWKQEVGSDGSRWADGCEHGIVDDPADVPVAGATEVSS